MIGEGKYPEVICEELLGYCLAPVCQMGGLGGDNMSIIIICMLHGKPWEDLVEKCKKIHAEKKASSKLSEPVFSQFDRFTADGPFAEVSVLKAADDGHNATDSNSSSSHTSSPSSSPISIDEKLDNLLGEEAEGAPKSENKSADEPSEESPKVEIQAVVVTTDAVEGETAESNKTNEEGPAPALDAPKDPIVSNGD
jgi:hypothetical protein